MHWKVLYVYLSFANVSGAFLSLASEYTIRLVLKIALLHADAADVKTTKLMIPAAATIPTATNTWTNGLSAGLIAFQGYTLIMTTSAPMIENDNSNWNTIDRFWNNFFWIFCFTCCKSYKFNSNKGKHNHLEGEDKAIHSIWEHSTVAP